MDASGSIEEVIDQLAPVVAERENEAVSNPRQLLQDLIPNFYTLVLRPNEEIISRLEKINQGMAEKFPGHYYYPLDSYHSTILGGIPVESVVDESKPTETVQNILKDKNIVTQPFGVMQTKAGVIIPLYFPQDSIHKLREELRAGIKLGQDYTSDHELWEHIGWIQLMRFTSQPTDDFTKYIRQIRATDFPKITNPKIELLTTTSKTLAPGKYQVIKNFT